MTNVKIKLMFFVLNALLTADFVYSRPYNLTSSNTTQMYIIPFNNTEDISIPVQSNADTLIVANDETALETPEQTAETNKNSNTEMKAMMDAEQGRDEHILKKNNKQQTQNVQEPSKEEPEKPANSSTLMQDIIDSETGRDDTLTDIMFRPEFDDGPRFEFLISAKINETNTSGSFKYSDNDISDKNLSDVIRKTDYVELVAIGKNPKGENKSAYSLLNITGHEVDNDIAPDTSYTDMQTVVMACVGTLVPLLAVLFVTLCVRSLCRRCCPRRCAKSSVSSASESSENKDDNQEAKTPAHSAAGETLDTDSDTPPANGSIITMTLKNNHLIVETEERSDITKNGRETKMKYSPDNDGIFVVEVQQSAIYRPNHKPLSSPPHHDPQISTNQALIHHVPEEPETSLPKLNGDEISDQTFGGRGLAMSNTGLSISDLSISSIGSHNVSYSYGSQTGYEQGPFGYPVYAGYDIPKEDIGDGIIHDNSREPLICKTPTDPDKPVVTAAIFKQDSIIGSEALQGPGYCIEGSSDGPLLSDVQAREVSLQQLHGQMEKKTENGVAVQITEKVETPKKTLNRADSLPVTLEDEIAHEPVIDKTALPMDAIKEDDFEINKESLKAKRASLPIILVRTEMYECVKDALIPTGSPKFEKFTNDISPSDNDGGDNPPPMITITEENETAAKLENGS